MPRNHKPRKSYRRRLSVYPDLEDVGLIFRPIARLFDQLRKGEVDSAKGRPIFIDWRGKWCEAAPALDGWADCWERIASGEKLSLSMVAVRRLSNRLDFGISLTEDEVEAAWQEIAACKAVMLRVPRRLMGAYLRTEQVAIELSRIGVLDAA